MDRLCCFCLVFVMPSCHVRCLIVYITDLCPLSYFYNMDVIYMYAVFYCLCQNPTIIFESVSSKG